MVGMEASTRPASGWSRVALVISGLAYIVALVLLLVLTADTSPTTPTTRRLFGNWRMRSVLPALALALVGIGLILASGSLARVLPYLSAIFATMTTLALLEGVGLAGLVSWNDLFKPRSDQLGRLGTARVPNLDAKGVTYQDTPQAWRIDSDPIPFH